MKGKKLKTHNNKDDHHKKTTTDTQTPTYTTKTNIHTTISTSIERIDYEEYVQKHAFITKTCTRTRYRELEGATPDNMRKHLTGKQTTKGAGTRQSTTNQHRKNIYGPDSEDSTRKSGPRDKNLKLKLIIHTTHIKLRYITPDRELMKQM